MELHDAERNKDFQIWQIERQLLAARLSLFLLTSSILYLSYVQVRTNLLGIFISSMGIASCVLGFMNFNNARKRLDRVERKLKLDLEASNGLKLRARIIAIIYPIFFLVIWAGSLIFSLCELNYFIN